jgi:hypothetical protein
MMGRNVLRSLKVDNINGTLNHRNVEEIREENFRYGVDRGYTEVLLGVERYLEQLRIQQKWSDVPVSFSMSHREMLKNNRTEIEKMGLLRIAIKLARNEFIDDMEFNVKVNYSKYHEEDMPFKLWVKILKSARKAAMHLIK